MRSPFFIRLRQWEYWPSKLFYWPMFFYVPWLQLRSFHLCFFSAANPGIDTGGIGLESKYETILLTPKTYRPHSYLTKAGTSFAEIQKALAIHNISFPLIAKPDMGFRGLLVTKIFSSEELQKLLEAYPVDFVLQELIDGKEEFGVFYYRMPDQESGTISSLTLKTFLSVTGNGRDNVLQLIQQNDRALLQLERLKKTHQALFNQVPDSGKIVPLGIIGNHSKGTRFINGAAHIDKALVNTFDKISKKIEGFYYGRFDVKCPSLADLKAGKNIHILEINGCCSEPTHIYDQNRISYAGALREILKHWTIIYKISRMNRKNGVACTPVLEMARRFLALPGYMRKLRDKI